MFYVAAKAVTHKANEGRTPERSETSKEPALRSSGQARRLSFGVNRHYDIRTSKEPAGRRRYENRRVAHSAQPFAKRLWANSGGIHERHWRRALLSIRLPSAARCGSEA
jgi:hypothetical protein